MGLGKRLEEFALRWNKHNEPKTVNIFLGVFFIVNFCLGTGFLGVPYSFYYSGYLAAIPTMFIISFVSWINATYIVECVARAQVRTSSSSKKLISTGSPSSYHPVKLSNWSKLEGLEL